MIGSGRGSVHDMIGSGRGSVHDIWIREKEIEIERGIIEQALAVLVGVSGCGVIQKVTANMIF